MAHHVLLIDDNNATNFLHKKFFSKASGSFNVESFEMGKSALEYLENEGTTFPNLIFVDINMPTMDAWEFLEELNALNRKEIPTSKIFLLTTSLSPEDVKKSEDYELIEEILIKPLNLPKINKLISEHLN